MSLIHSWDFNDPSNLGLDPGGWNCIVSGVLSSNQDVSPGLQDQDVGDFDGSSYMGYAPTAGANFGPNYTFSAWIFPRSIDEFASIFSCKVPVGGSNFWGIQNGKLNLSLNGIPVVGNDNLVGLIEDEWQHVGVSVDGTRVLFYLNGVNIYSGKCSVQWTGVAAGQFLIGLNDEFGVYLDAQLDRLRIFDEAKDTQYFIDAYNQVVVP